MFSEELDGATVIPGAFVLRAAGEAQSPVAVAVEGAVVTVTPAGPLSDSRLYELGLAASLRDLTGNALVPTTVRFSTVDLTAPETPVLDPLPPLFCAVTKDVTGRAEPGSTVFATGGAAVAQATVRAGGAFTVSVPLRAETHQTLSVVARDGAGNASPAANVSLTTDCTPPQVVDVVRTATDLTVSFDEAIDAATLLAGDTVRLDETTGSTGTLPVSLVLSTDGLVLTITSPGRDLGALAFGLALSSGVRDLAGNALVPFVRGFAPLSGATVLVGELFDDATSRPLGSGSATLLVAGGVASAEPLPRASVTGAGLYALPAIDGDALVRLSAPGYLDVWRRTAVVATAGATPSETLFDARLTPVAPAAVAAPRDGGTLFTASDTPAAPTAVAASKVTLFAPGGALSPGTVATLTLRSAQGLPVLPPLGWSVAGATHVRLVDVSGDPVDPSAPLTLRIPDSYGASTATPLTLARLDATGLAWIAEGTASLSEGALEAFVSQAGDWAVFVPDPPPTAPPAASPGAPLEGTILPASDPLEAATVSASPADVLASQTAAVSLTVSSALPVPSGFPIQCLVTEELTLLDGSSVAAPSFLSDLLLQRRGDGTTGLSILVRASEMARRAALSIGWERFAVKRFPFEVRQGTVVTPAGGSVPGPAGWSLGMPEGAVAAPVSVTLTPLAPTDLPVAIPEGFTLLGSVRVGSGGAAFSLPAALSVRLAAPPPAGQDFLLVALEERAGIVVLRPVARAAWDEATSRLATRPIDRAVFPWPGVRGDGTYAFVASSEPLAFVSGRLFGLDGSPLPSVDVRVAGWPLVGVSEADGLFALAIRALPETVGAVEPSTGDLAALTVAPPAPGAALVGVELRIVATPPWVAAVTPAPGATVLVHSRFTVEFSEPLDPLSVTPESIFLAAHTGGGDAVVVAARMEASAGSRSVVVIPEATLPGNTSLVLTLRSTLRDLAGRGLVDRVTRLPAEFVATFTTEDLTPPDGKPWLVTIGLPSGDPQAPTVEIVGIAGAVCPGCHVVATNDTTQATAATDALSDGSFRLTLAARATDAIRIEIEKANGTKQTLPAVPFTGDGGRTAIVGAGGGTWQTPEGYRLDVPQGAFTEPVTVTTTSLPRSGLDALVTPPRDVVWVDSFTLGMEAGGQPATARAGFDLSFAAPPPAGATDQFLLAQVVEVFGERRLMVVDLLRRSGDRLVTDRSGQALQALARQGLATVVDLGSSGVPGATFTVVPGSAVRPLDGFGGGSFDRTSTFFDGVVKKGTYALYNTATLMAVVAGSFSGATLYASSSESDFVFAGTEVLTRNLYRLVTPAGRPFTLTLRDVDSGLALFQGDVTPGIDPNLVTPVDPPMRLDPEPPAVLSASPALVHRFLAPPAVSGGAGTDIAPRIQAESTLSGSHVRVTLTGGSGAVSPGAVVRLLNVSAEPGSRCGRRALHDGGPGRSVLRPRDRGRPRRPSLPRDRQHRRPDRSADRRPLRQAREEPLLRVLGRGHPPHAHGRRCTAGGTPVRAGGDRRRDAAGRGDSGSTPGAGPEVHPERRRSHRHRQSRKVDDGTVRGGARFSRARSRRDGDDRLRPEGPGGRGAALRDRRKQRHQGARHQPPAVGEPRGPVCVGAPSRTRPRPRARRLRPPRLRRRRHGRVRLPQGLRHPPRLGLRGSPRRGRSRCRRHAARRGERRVPGWRNPEARQLPPADREGDLGGGADEPARGLLERQPARNPPSLRPLRRRPGRTRPAPAADGEADERHHGRIEISARRAGRVPRALARARLPRRPPRTRARDLLHGRRRRPRLRTRHRRPRGRLRTRRLLESFSDRSLPVDGAPPRLRRQELRWRPSLPARQVRRLPALCRQRTDLRASRLAAVGIRRPGPPAHHEPRRPRRRRRDTDEDSGRGVPGRRRAQRVRARLLQHRPPLAGATRVGREDSGRAHRRTPRAPAAQEGRRRDGESRGHRGCARIGAAPQRRFLLRGVAGRRVR
ncbi:MAG: Ig-like domain-containing protein [Holophagales bacterium]|nr:Ig-like domain-containing protein [Holophagales bacterium]